MSKYKLSNNQRLTIRIALCAVFLSFLAVIVSGLSYWQTDKIHKENIKITAIRETKDNAEKYFEEEKYPEAFKEYKKLKDLDPTDLSGYYNFVDEAKKILLSNFPNCRKAREYYHDYAKALHNLPDIETDSLLNDKCK